MNSLRALLIGTALSTAGGMQGQIQLQSATDRSPIPGATIRSLSLDAAGSAWASDAFGRFDASEHSGPFQVSAIGFESISFHPDTLPHGVLQLQPATYALAQAVVTGQFTGHTDRDAVQSVRVINRTDIERIGAISLRDALLTQSSMNLQHDAQLGTNITMLGLSGRHVQVLVDGLPVVGRVDGNIDLDQLPLDQVQRIEIVEGPMSVEYGSEAIAGTINLITLGGAPMASSLRLVGETVGRSQVLARWTVADGRLEGRASRTHFSGFNPDGTEGRAALWKPKTQIGGELRSHLTRSNLRATSSALYQHETLYSDGAVQYRQETRPINDTLLGVFAVPFAQDAQFITRRAVLRNDVEGERGQGFIAYSHYQRERTTSWIDFTDLSTAPVTESGMNDTATFATWHSRASHQLPSGARWNATVGYDAQHETARGARIAGGRQSLTHAAVFASGEWQIGERFILRPGLRMMWNSAYDAPLIPSVHARWKSGPHRLRASFARGFRAPDLKELHFLFVDVNHNIAGSTDLRAEVSNAWQASYSADFLTERSLLRPSIQGFHNRVDDVIELGLVDAESQLYTYLNLSQTTTTGATLSFRRASERWTVEAQATGVHRQTWMDPSDDQPVEAFSLQASLSSDVQLGAGRTWTVQVNHQHRETLFQQVAEGDWALMELSPNTQLSSYLSQALLDGKLNLRGGIDNALNVTNRLLTGGAMPAGTHSGGSANAQPVAMGRNFKLTLQWNF